MKSRVVLGAVTASLLAMAGEAAAQTAYPVRLVSRPQTLPAMGLRLDGAFNVLGISACATALGRTTCVSDTATALHLGAGFGVLDQLEVGANVAPLQLSPEFAYGNPSVYGRYQFLRGDQLQLSGQVSVTIPVRDGSKLGFTVGAPLWFNFTDLLQLQTGVFYNASLTDPYSHGLSVPLRLNFNLNDNVHVAGLTGFGFNFDAPGKSLDIPLGLEGGYAIAGANNRPMLDLVAQFQFPSFLTPGSDGDVVNTSLWLASLQARFYLFF